ncbi:MAG: diguanylate cyclase [Ruminiclostridium sp.]|jgi:diguanylate cyclase (GGDEF)-like protein|nr:diguanylate cyclase [Ruminiclostridium sp.]MCI9467070.1 diguanylate cyclase [Ruminiclostridium sp.]
MERLSDKQKILIVDDSEMNRSILADMLGEEYEIMEAEDGNEGVAMLQQHSSEIALVLLDIVMPNLDGFGVLSMMNRYRWIEEVPVIMISAERGSSHVERAFEMGVTDFISRPFDALLVHRRVVNTILLYTKQKKLVSLVADQIYEKEHRSSLMIDILSNIVEFRNGESGLHVRHVHTLTEMLLKVLIHKTDRYHLSQTDISIISTASALHDVGKISIDENVLNKPGRLTKEEFEIMKTHSMIGAEMLAGLPIHQDEPLVKAAYEICRWHHERYDGRGYPDGLKGDEIPISAQIVALADVYDALTSERVYKKAFSHEKAVTMILNGECGTFNPLLMECLEECADGIQEELRDDNAFRRNQREMQNIAREMHKYEELTASERTLQLLEHERMKYNFFADLSKEIQFEFTLQPPMVTLSAWGAETLGLEEIVMEPETDPRVMELIGKDSWRGLADALRATTPGQPTVTFDCLIHYKESAARWTRILARAIWSPDEPPRYTGAIGKAIDVHDSRMHLDNLERMATHDAMTGLLNHATAKKRIQERLEERPEGRYALAILDLDHFKSANDNYGHSFGDQVLIYMADKLRQNTRGGDIAARVGGDEMVVFLECKIEVEPAIERIFNAVTGMYEQFPLSVSIGVATTEKVGTDYETLFHAADQALYTVKRSGRGHYRFYDESMDKTLSAISPIDSDGEEG